MSTQTTRNEFYDAAVQDGGQFGRVRIAAGETYNTHEIKYVKPITNDFTYGAGCVAKRGDAPADGDAVLQGDIDSWPATTVVCATGAAWLYPKDKLADN